MAKVNHNNISYSETSYNISTATAVKTNTIDVFTVCIDAGHGDWDVGAEGVYGSHEKDINLAVSLKLGALLEDFGINVVYTRTSDTLTWSDNSTENLYERVAISEENDADLFISIHCNKSDESYLYNGIETWYNPNDNESEIFASLIQEELANLNYTEDRGIKYYSEDYTLAVLEHNSAPSALVELGFLSNFYDEEFLNSEYGQSLCAEALSNAIIEAYNTNLNSSLNSNL